ncbi:uncharacterized protein FFB20_06285 [Fusarium fujikuroi]|nr:uncharacterized protein FFB20_06285 [Fusarium fujikuroi]SCV60531.1 uncharacterized protein FFFS_15100 [Fusarium fujikuroi]
MFFYPICCYFCIRRRRAGSTASNRPSEERALNGGPPENQDGGERPQEIELPNSDVVQPDVPPDVQQGDPQQANHQQGSESRTVTGRSPSCKDPRDEEQDNSSSSDDAPSPIVARYKTRGRRVSRYQKVKQHMSQGERDMIEAMSQFN